MAKSTLLAASTALLLSACAGREAVPVAQVQPYDSQLSCEQILAEQQDINTKVAALQNEKDSAHEANIAIGTVGAILFWPALFALDTSDAEDVEMQAYRSRSQHLSTIAGQKGCFAGTPANQSVPAAAPATESGPSPGAVPASAQAAAAEPTDEAAVPSTPQPSAAAATSAQVSDEKVICELDGVVQPRSRGYCLDEGGRVVES